MAASEKNMHWLKKDENAANTTTRMQDVASSGSASITVNVIRRVTASPRQVKTQIAKLSYGPRGDLKSTTKKKLHPATPPLTPKTSETAKSISTRKEFDKKKDERNKEIQEIQHMLNEITKSPKKIEAPPKSTQPTKNISKETAKPTGSATFRRSKTELLIERPKTASTVHRREVTRSDAVRARSKSSQPPETKSHELLPENAFKKRSYNKEETRRFMQEQKKKRRSNKASAALLHTNRQKTELEKEQIKKRLAELHKNTRKIVSKNLKRKHTMSAVNIQSGVEIFGGAQEGNGSNFSEGIAIEITLGKIQTASSENTQIVTHNNELSLETHKPDIILPDDKRIQIPNKYNAAINPLMENQKRIGLLRKPELKDHSFSAIKEFSFDKENIALDMMTPKLTGVLESRVKEKSLNDEAPKDANEAVQQTQVTSATPVVEITAHDLQLTIPLARLKKPNTFRFEKSTEAQSQASITSPTAVETKSKESEKEPHINLAKAQTDLPYWLKPSAVQVYPYNFIMAVRRKLEAIANPPPVTFPHVHLSTNNKTTSIASDLCGGEAKKSYETPLTSVPKDRMAEAQQNVKRRIVHDSAEESYTDDSFATHTIENSITNKNVHFPEVEAVQTCKENLMPESAQLLSNLNSNFSSISIRLPSSNTISEISALKSESVHHTRSGRKPGTLTEDDTTAPSSIFNSPEKKLQPSAKFSDDFEFVAPARVSPLSLDRIENLKITSRNKLKNAIAARHINTERGENLNDCKYSLKTGPKRKHASENIGQTFNQLLDDFNRSLSQVLQVNEQLKSTINKSQKVFTPRCDGTSFQNRLDTQKETSEYSTDFEESSEVEAHNKIVILEKATSKKNTEEIPKNVHKRKKHLFEIETAPKSDIDGGSSSSSQQVDKQPALPSFDINLESATNSSVNSTENHEHEYAVLKTDEPSPQEFEKRLQVIEHLKTNLRQSILNSKANRADDRNVEEYENVNKTSSSVEKKSKHKSHRSTTLNAAAIDTVDKTKIKSPSKSTLNSSASSSQQYHSDSISPTKAQKFLIHHSDTNTKSAQTHKSNDYNYDKTISEDIQSEYESHSKDNNNHNDESIKRKSPFKEIKKQETAAIFRKTHINNTTKNEEHINGNNSNSTALIAPPSYNGITVMEPEKPTALNKSSTNSAATQSIGSEIAAIFNQSDLELSILPASESSISYSSVGLYEKLIQKETTKSEHLTALLKIREKALLDRTKGQIAWLEVQKERYKAKGLLVQITAIKKKQRAILLKMDKEREEIKRLLQSTTSTASTHSSTQRRPLQEAAVCDLQPPQSPLNTVQYQNQDFSTYTHRIQSGQLSARASPPLLLSIPPALPKAARCSSPLHQQHHQNQTVTVATIRSAPIVRANYELESSRSLEELLQKREADLQRRREHVTRLMKWHQRLDQEETEVLQLEHMLLNCNNVHAQQQQQASTTEIAASVFKDSIEKEEENKHGKLAVSHIQEQNRQAICAGKMERRLKEIDQSLQELNSINTTSNSIAATTTTSSINNEENDGINTAAPTSLVPTTSNTDDNTDAVEDVVIDFVRTTGYKLNKLWRRLTSQQIEKFEPNQRYKLCKSDLARLYEDAKIAVLNDFANDERMTTELLEKSTSNLSNSTNIQACAKNTVSAVDTIVGGDKVSMIYVPKLNLNFSSEQSEQEEVGNYSPSAAEEDFQMHTTTTGAIASMNGGNLRSESSASSSSESDDGSSVTLENMERREQNMQKFLSLREGFAAENFKLHRSRSDSEIVDQTSRNFAHKKSTSISHRNVAIGHHRNMPPSKSDSATATDNSSPLTSADTLQGLQSLKSQTQVASVSVGEIISISSELNGSNDSPNIATYITNSSGEKHLMCLTAPVELSLASPQSTVDSNIAKQMFASNTLAAAMKSESISQVLNSGASQANTSESKAREISAKLEQISAAVTQLSQANSILTAAMQCPTTVCEGALNIIDAGTSSISANDNNELQNLSPDISYSCHFENISTDMQSPTGCTLKGASSSSTNSHKVVIETSRAKETAAESNNSASPSPATFTSTISNSSAQAKFQSKTVECNNVASSPSATFITSAASLQSKTYVCESKTLLSELETEENRVLDTYEADFEGSDETQLEEISVPQFEATTDTILNDDDDDEVITDEEAAEEEKYLRVQTAQNVENKLKPALSSSTFPSPPPLPPALHTASSAVATGDATDNGVQLMPDIINELEIRRCQQILLENENFKQYEHVAAVPYMYVREIPNKPPPPYVPPAHGSPMTTIFPSENRIKDITYRRTHELYCDLLETDYINDEGEKLPSVMEEKITNIYERIILDICREYLAEHHEVLTQGDPTNFHSQLAFFNPPDRLRCIQDSIYKEVRRCLAMDKTLPKRTQVYSVYGQRAKRDHIGKIIIQEMYDEDEKWCNFHREENEVLELIVEEMIGNNVQQLAREVLLEEGGTIEEENDVDEEENEEDVADARNRKSLDETELQKTERLLSDAASRRQAPEVQHEQ